MNAAYKTIKTIQLTDEECTIIGKANDIFADLIAEVPKMNKLFRVIDTSTDDYETVNSNDLHAAAIFLNMLTEYDNIEVED